MKIENDLRARREELKMSRNDVAAAADCTVSAVYAAESGGMPRGGQATIDKIEAVLRGEKGGAVSAETMLAIGDVVSGTILDEQLLLLVRKVPDTATVEGTQLDRYDGDAMKEAFRAGGIAFKFRGRVYVMHHTRTMRRENITGHWAQEPPSEPTLASQVL